MKIPIFPPARRDPAPDPLDLSADAFNLATEPLWVLGVLEDNGTVYSFVGPRTQVEFKRDAYKAHGGAKRVAAGPVPAGMDPKEAERRVREQVGRGVSASAPAADGVKLADDDVFQNQARAGALMDDVINDLTQAVAMARNVKRNVTHPGIFKGAARDEFSRVAMVLRDIRSAYERTASELIR